MQLMIAETNFQEFKRVIRQSLTEGYRVVPGTLVMQTRISREVKKLGVALKSEYFVVFLERED